MWKVSHTISKSEKFASHENAPIIRLNQQNVVPSCFTRAPVIILSLNWKFYIKKIRIKHTITFVQLFCGSCLSEVVELDEEALIMVPPLENEIVRDMMMMIISVGKGAIFFIQHFGNIFNIRMTPFLIYMHRKNLK